MTSTITSKGKDWEFRNSIWMLWTLLSFGVFNYISFFYIGRKVKQKKWSRAGIVYLAIFIISMSAPDSFAGLLIIGWIVSIIHVFRIRTEYLLRLEALQVSGMKNKEIAKLRETIAKEYDLPSTKTTEVTSGVGVPSVVNANLISEEKNYQKVEEKNLVEKRIDINTASEQQIASVPGIGNIFAAKVVSVRGQENGFQSFDHFVQALSVKPHLAEKMKSHVFFSNVSSNEYQVKRTEGRIVDF